MSSLTQKLTQYLAKSEAQPSTVARYMGLSTLKFTELLDGKLTKNEVSPEGFARLASETGIASTLWLDDAQELPATLPIAVRRGRKAKDETPAFMQDQSKRRKRLESLMARYGSKEAFAAAIGQQPSAISHYLRNRSVTDGFLLRVAQATGVSADWLLKGEGTIDDKKIETPQPETRHEGQLLERYLKAKGINDRELGLMMGYPEASASGSVGQIRRKSRQLTPDVKEKILRALNVTEIELFRQNIEESSQKIEEIQENKNLSNLVLRKFTGQDQKLDLDAVSGRVVDLPIIPAHLRADFHFAQFMSTATRLNVPYYRLKRLQNPGLTPEQQREELSRYAVLQIGTDYMEPAGLVPGVDAIMYQLPPERWGDESGVMAVEKANGRLFVGRVRQNTLATEKRLSLVTDNPLGGSLVAEIEEIVHLWKLETLIADVI